MSARPYDVPERQIDPDCESPRFVICVAVDPDCQACTIADELAVTCGCGTDDWYCSHDCRRQGEHTPRHLRVCLHQPLERVL